MWLYQVAHLVSRDQTRANMTAIAGILVGRARRLIRVGVGIVVVADCPMASPAKGPEREKRREARRIASAAVPCGDEIDAAAEGERDAGELDALTSSSAAAAVPTDESTTTALGCLFDVHDAFQTLSVLTLMSAAGIATLISPYDADHQRAHLCAVGIIHAVISVDSDMLVLGVPHLVLRGSARTTRAR